MTELTKVVEMWATIIQTIAIGVAGIWAFFRYRLKREDYIKAILDLDVQLHKIKDKKYLIRVKVKINNVGSSLLEPSNCLIYINQVVPISNSSLVEISQKKYEVGDSDDILQWPNIATRTIKLYEGELVVEPNVTEEIWCDFVLESEAKVLEIYARINSDESGEDFRGTVKFLEL